jgi:glycogen synthase
MRLLITTDTVGGVWTFTKELVQGLVECGHSMALVSFGRMPSQSQQNDCALIAKRWPDRFWYIPSSTPLEWMEDNVNAFSGAAPLLAEIAAKFGAQLLHSNQFCFGALDFPIPRIVTAHSDVLSWARYSRSESLCKSPWLEQYISLVQNGLSGADITIAPTYWMLQELASFFALSEATKVIENGRTISQVGKKKKILQAVTAGRVWDEAKGLHLLKDLHSPLSILVAGEKQAKDTASLEVAGEAQFLGPLSEDELLTLFCRSALYLCTSCYEPFGLAPLEAALCGCAVLARDIPSLREVWGDNVLYFSDSASLSMLLHKLNRDPDMLKAAQHSSFGRAQWFTRNRMVEQYLHVYRALLATKKESTYVA